jgi:hypothetical protein
MFGKDSGQPPIAVDAAGLPASGAGTASTSGAPADGRPPSTDDSAGPQQPRKRGFWSRVFGGGGDKDKKQEEKEQKKQ